MCNFRIGQKVVCVDAVKTTWHRKKFLGLFGYVQWTSELREGEVYTITDVFPGKCFMTGRESMAVRVAEVPDYESSGFRATRFRPLVTRKTDISIFKAMLTPKNEQVVA